MIVGVLSVLVVVCAADPEPRYPPSSYPTIQSPYTYKLHLSDCHYVNETECVTQEELRCALEDKEVCVEVGETECQDEEEEVCTTVETVTDIDVDRFDIVETLSLIVIGMFQGSCDSMQQCQCSAL